LKAWQVSGDLGKREPQVQTILNGMERLRRFGKKLGPYLMLEILLPGGTLFALLLFLYQRTGRP